MMMMMMTTTMMTMMIMMMTGDVCLGQTMTDTQNILTSILTGYNPDIRPATDQSQPVKVNVSMELVNIKEFNELAEHLSSVIILYMSWVDKRLTWDPSSYNNIQTIILPVRRIWRPNLFLTAPVGESRPIGGAHDWPVVKCSYDGVVFWEQGDAISSSCRFDVRHFPFDKQKCKLKFIPWGFRSNEISLSALEDEVGLTFFVENGAWNLSSSSIVSNNVHGKFSVFSVTLVLERRPTFFLVNAVLPVILISFLNVLVFVIPVECGERISYAITVYLALAVFMTIVGDNMPKNSKEMAIICYFLMINVAHSTIICLEIIVSSVTFYREGPVPPLLCRVFMQNSESFTNKDRKIKTERTQAPNDLEDITYGWRKTDGTPDNVTGITCVDDRINTPPLTWRDVSRSLDKIFGIVSAIILFIFLVVFIGLVVNS